MSKLTYSLQSPVQITPDRRISDLGFRTASTAGDMRRLDGRPEGVAGGVAVLSPLSGEPVAVIEALSVADFRGVEGILSAFVDSMLARCRVLAIDPARFALGPSLKPTLPLVDCLFPDVRTVGSVQRLSLPFTCRVEMERKLS